MVEKDQSVLAAEPQRDAVGGRAAACGHRRDRDDAEKIVQLWRRDDNARAGLLNFRSDRRIERREPNFTSADDNGTQEGNFVRCAGSPYQVRVSSSSLPNSGQTDPSSRASAMLC